MILLLIIALLLVCIFTCFSRSKDGFSSSGLKCPGGVVAEISGYDYQELPKIYEESGNELVPSASTYDSLQRIYSLTYCGIDTNKLSKIAVSTSQGVQPYLNWKFQDGKTMNVELKGAGKYKGKYFWN